MYFVLERFLADHPARWMDDTPFLKGVFFSSGERISKTIPQPLEYTLEELNDNSNDMGPEMPELFLGDIPLFRDDLIATMREAGVDNLDVYDAVIHDPDSGENFSNYKAVNIIGVIAAADMAKSTATIHTGGPVIDVEFDHLVLNEEKARGALIFRLAENTGIILVHEKLRDHLRSRGFNALAFLDPGTIAT